MLQDRIKRKYGTVFLNLNLIFRIKSIKNETLLTFTNQLGFASGQQHYL